MKKIDKAELLSEIVEPPKAPPKLMTKREKLFHWSRIMAECSWPMTMMYGIEDLPRLDLDRLRPDPHCAMGIAVNDPEFQKQGLSPTATIDEVMTFFSISRRDFHDFGCGCRGHLGNYQQAAIVENLAMRS